MFATINDLESRLGRTLESGERQIAEFALTDATAYLRGVIGAQVSPPAQVTVRDYLSAGEKWVHLPGSPIVSVESVTVDGEDADFLHLDNAVKVRGHSLVEVTYTVGYATVPDELKAWACVLAADVLSSIDDLGALHSGGVAYVSIDDYRKGWQAGGDSSGFVLPQRVEDALKSRYGQSTHVVRTL
ncbi:hypothetical protein [Brevibacterium oceani]|uniref:hypothetical protein n=1 Tax=Brevibacterium oceani TaxID=358099 RepID=UPI0015E72359|nr:hypothetical protein [Brevibacterium oceani]